jgi:hypothetical protein
MTRRTLFQWLAALPIPALRVWAQTATFPGKYAPVLREIGAIVLPGELGRAGTDRIVDRFERYVREYRPGADMDHGYGATRLRVKPASPAPAYLRQLASIPLPVDSKIIEDALRQADIQDLPRFPEGKHVAADLMAFYFHSRDANDLCYRAAIGRDQCRGLDGSDQPPPPWKGSLG